MGVSQPVIGWREHPVLGIWHRRRRDRRQLFADDAVCEVIKVQVILVIAEWVFNFLAGNQEAEEKKARNDGPGNSHIPERWPKLEGLVAHVNRQIWSG